jgi:hypothetical protein
VFLGWSFLSVLIQSYGLVENFIVSCLQKNWDLLLTKVCRYKSVRDSIDDNILTHINMLKIHTGPRQWGGGGVKTCSNTEATNKIKILWGGGDLANSFK